MSSSISSTTIRPSRPPSPATTRFWTTLDPFAASPQANTSPSYSAHSINIGPTETVQPIHPLGQGYSENVSLAQPEQFLLSTPSTIAQPINTSPVPLLRAKRASISSDAASGSASAASITSEYERLNTAKEEIKADRKGQLAVKKKKTVKTRATYIATNLAHVPKAPDTSRYPVPAWSAVPSGQRVVHPPPSAFPGPGWQPVSTPPPFSHSLRHGSSGDITAARSTSSLSLSAPSLPGDDTLCTTTGFQMQKIKRGSVSLGRASGRRASMKPPTIQRPAAVERRQSVAVLPGRKGSVDVKVEETDKGGSSMVCTSGAALQITPSCNGVALVPNPLPSAPAPYQSYNGHIAQDQNIERRWSSPYTEICQSLSLDNSYHLTTVSQDPNLSDPNSHLAASHIAYTIPSHMLDYASAYTPRLLPHNTQPSLSMPYFASNPTPGPRFKAQTPQASIFTHAAAPGPFFPTPYLSETNTTFKSNVIADPLLGTRAVTEAEMALGLDPSAFGPVMFDGSSMFVTTELAYNPFITTASLHGGPAPHPTSIIRATSAKPAFIPYIPSFISPSQSTPKSSPISFVWGLLE